jgi:hypothetical protein
VPEVDHPQWCIEHSVEHVQNVVASDTKDGINALCS